MLLFTSGIWTTSLSKWKRIMNLGTTIQWQWLICLNQLTNKVDYFSFGVKHFSENKVHYTNNIYCEDKYILSYIDSGEIPPLLTDIIDEWWCFKWNEENSAIRTETEVEGDHPINHYSNVYYNGCILAEIRNHRLPSINPESFLSYFILLKPSRLNHQNEINKIKLSTTHKFKWNNKALLEIEAILIQANAPKLYLDLNPNVFSLARVSKIWFELIFYLYKIYAILLFEQKFARRKDILCENQFVRMRRKRLKKSLPFGLSASKSFSLLNFIKANPRPKLPPLQISLNTVNNHELFNTIKPRDIVKLAEEINAKESSEDEQIVIFEEYLLEQLDNPKSARLVIFHNPVYGVFYGAATQDKRKKCSKPQYVSWITYSSYLSNVILLAVFLLAINHLKSYMWITTLISTLIWRLNPRESLIKSAVNLAKDSLLNQTFLHQDKVAHYYCCNSKTFLKIKECWYRDKKR